MTQSYQSTVLKQKEVCEGIFELTLEGREVPKPGQFYMVKRDHGDYLLPRPISVYDFCEGKLKLLYRVEGKGTKSMARLKEGDTVQLLGPLGNGFDVDQMKGKVGIVGGGIGIAPLLYLAKKLEPKSVDIYLGYKEQDYCADSFQANGNKVTVVTESGKLGFKGFVTDFVKWDQYDTIVTCGPEIMMEKILRESQGKEVTVFASLERRMACGVGACLGCVVKTTTGNQRACKEGPVFNADHLILD